MVAFADFGVGHSEQIVLLGQGLLVLVQFLSLLDLLHDSLDGGLFVALGELLLGRLDLRGVAQGVGHLRNDLLVGDLVVLAAHPARLALGGEVAGVHDPLLGAERADKLVVVRDDDDAALELGDGVGQGAEALAVQIVGRLCVMIGLKEASK